MTHQEFASTLVAWRKRTGHSQRSAAEALGCSKRTLENWEQERAMPQGFGLRAILEILTGQSPVAATAEPVSTAEAPEELDTHLL